MEQFKLERSARVRKRAGVAITKMVALGLLLLALLWPNEVANAQKSKALPTQTNSAAVDWPNTGSLTGMLGDMGFHSDAYIKAAIELQAMGKDKACAALKVHAEAWNYPSDTNYDVFVLCRMLFVAKPGGEFRGPGLGEPFPHGTDGSDWPLEPIAISDGVPFWIENLYGTDGYRVGPTPYLEYCIKNCDWNSYRYSPKTKAQEELALSSLLIPLKLKGKFNDSDRQFFADQIR